MVSPAHGGRAAGGVESGRLWGLGSVASWAAGSCPWALQPGCLPLWAVEVPEPCLLISIGVRAEELTRWGRARA